MLHLIYMSQSEFHCIACYQLIHQQAKVCHHCQSPQHNSWARLGLLFKWLGSLTVVISVVMGLYQVNALFQQFSARQQAVVEWVEAGRLQAEQNDFENAWRSFAQAENLDPGNPLNRLAQVTVAMRWIRKSHANEEVLSKVAEQLVSVLYRGLVAKDTNQALKADIYAHLNVLKYQGFYRGDLNNTSIDASFKQIFALDENNVFGHIFKGLWLYRQFKPLDEVVVEFDLALKTQRESVYVYQMLVNTLAIRRDDVASMAIILSRLGTIEEKGYWSEVISQRLLRQLLSAYESRIHSEKHLLLTFRTPKIHSLE